VVATIALVALAAIVAAYWISRKRVPASSRLESTPPPESNLQHGTGTSAAPAIAAMTAAQPPRGGSQPTPPPPAESPGVHVDPAEQAIANLRRAARFGYAPLKDGQDNFSVILGIDGATAALLRANSINSFAMLAATPVRTLARLLDEAGTSAPQQGHDHWPVQARLCVRGEWEELKAFQQQLRSS